MKIQWQKDFKKPYKDQKNWPMMHNRPHR